MDPIDHDITRAGAELGDQGCVLVVDRQDDFGVIDRLFGGQPDPDRVRLARAGDGNWLHVGTEQLDVVDLHLAGTPTQTILELHRSALVGRVEVGVGDVVRCAEHAQLAVIDPRRPLTQSHHIGHRVGDEDDRLATIAEVGDAITALGLEVGIADRQHLVDDEYVGIDVDGDRKAEPHEHPRRVVLDRRVDELLEPGELDDVVEPVVHMLAGHTQDGSVEEHVLASAQFRVEPGPEFEQRRHAAVDRDAALVGFEDLGEALQQRRLAAAVVTDDAERFAGGDLEADVTERPEVFVRAAPSVQQRLLERLVALAEQPEPLRQVRDADDRVAVSGRSTHRYHATGRRRSALVTLTRVTWSQSHRGRQRYGA